MSAADRIDRKIHNARMRLDAASMAMVNEWNDSGTRLAVTSVEVENAVLALGTLLLERRRKQGMR